MQNYDKDISDKFDNSMSNKILKVGSSLLVGTALYTLSNYGLNEIDPINFSFLENFVSKFKEINTVPFFNEANNLYKSISVSLGLFSALETYISIDKFQNEGLNNGLLNYNNLN